MIAGNNKSLLEKTFESLNYLFLSLFIFFTLYPFYYCVMLSFNDGKDAESGGIYFWPRLFTLENYRRVFSDPYILVGFRNSILRTVIGVVLAVFFTAMYAYAVSRRDLLFKKVYLTIGIITMYFGGGLIPYYILINRIGLIDNFLVYIIPGLFSMSNAILFITYFRDIPVSLEESAKIDGANDIYIFYKIIFPVSLPIFACIALFIGVSQWNSWFDTMLYTNSDNLETLPHLMVKILNTQNYMNEMAA
ncbi:MAG TPA: carbohydrate ABC transporter permease, partial [Clostridiales bacterium]|nr:carbohydrate ABC transporter permease [Clostridiales bacterium]